MLNFGTFFIIEVKFLEHMVTSMVFITIFLVYIYIYIYTFYSYLLCLTGCKLSRFKFPCLIMVFFVCTG